MVEQVDRREMKIYLVAYLKLIYSWVQGFPHLRRFQTRSDLLWMLIQNMHGKWLFFTNTEVLI